MSENCLSLEYLIRHKTLNAERCYKFIKDNCTDELLLLAVEKIYDTWGELTLQSLGIEQAYINDIARAKRITEILRDYNVDMYLVKNCYDYDDYVKQVDYSKYDDIDEETFYDLQSFLV